MRSIIGVVTISNSEVSNEDLQTWFNLLDQAFNSWTTDATAKKPEGVTLDIPEIVTRLIHGREEVFRNIINVLTGAKSTVTIILPKFSKEFLETLSNIAYKHKTVRYQVLTHVEPAYKFVAEAILKHGNILLRHNNKEFEYMCCLSDAKEMVLAPIGEEMIGVYSKQGSFYDLINDHIRPIAISNTRPFHLVKF